MTQVHYLYSRDIQSETLSSFLYHLLIAKQYRYYQTFLLSYHRSLEHIISIGFAEYHAFGFRLSLVEYTTHQLIVIAHEFTQFLIVSFPILNRTFCHTALHSSASHSRSHSGKQAWIKGLGQYIITSIMDIGHVISRVHNRRHRKFCQIRYCTHRGKLHCLVYHGSPAVQCSTEYIWESKHIVYLIGVITSSGREYQVRSRSHSLIISYFRIGICQCEYYRVWSHRLQHFSRHDILYRQSEEHIGIYHSLCKSIDIPLGHKFPFLSVEIGA